MAQITLVEVKAKAEKELQRLEKEYNGIVEQLKFLKELKELQKEEILSSFNILYGDIGATFRNLDTGGTLQRIIASKTIFDEDVLKQLLTSKQWKAIAKEVVDRDKFGAACKVGIINEAELGKAIKHQREERIVSKSGKA